MDNRGMNLAIQHLRGMATLFAVFFHFRYLLNLIVPKVKLGDLLFGKGDSCCVFIEKHLPCININSFFVGKYILSDISFTYHFNKFRCRHDDSKRI